MRTRTLATSILGLAALPLLASGTASAVLAPAAAAAPGAPVVYEDEIGDTAGAVDMTTVTASLFGRTDGRLRVQVKSAQRQHSGDYTAIFFDVDRSNPGPELRLSGARDSEYALMRVDSWVDFHGREVRNCDFFRMKQARDGSFMSGAVDLDCLGDPRKVRFDVSVEGPYDPENVDWLGTAKAYSVYSVR